MFIKRKTELFLGFPWFSHVAMFLLMVSHAAHAGFSDTIVPRILPTHFIKV